MHEPKSYLHVLDESFPGIKDHILIYESLGFNWESSRLFLKEENGKAISHVGLFECPMLLEGRWCTAGFLHAVCTKNSSRGRGLASELIQEALIWAKNRCELVIAFTEIPQFYEKISFHRVQESRFHLPCRHLKGASALRPLMFPEDNALFLRIFLNRTPASHHVWIKDNGAIAAFNTLWTRPRFWSLYYSASSDAIISYLLEGKTLHLLDIVAHPLPSLQCVLEHFSHPIDEIYFYFSPDRLTDAASAQPHLYDKGYLMVHGKWPYHHPFMISPLSRC